MQPGRSEARPRGVIPTRLLLALALLLAGCATAARPVADGWERLPDPPLSPRARSVLAWTGSELLVLGGDVSPPCPGGASCVGGPALRRDGAALDPVRSTWRRVADAPLPPAGRAVLLGGTVWVQAARALLAYDVRTDRWVAHPPPPGTGRTGWQLYGSRGLLVALVSSEEGGTTARDALFDPAIARWELLPPDALRPSFDRSAVDTPDGLLVTGAKVVPPSFPGPSLMRAELLDTQSRSWHRLPDSEQLVATGGVAHGGKVWFPMLGVADGGEVNGWGRTVPYGGYLDLARTRWAHLTDPPDERTGGWVVQAPGGRLSAASGWLFDADTESWSSLARPADAPERAGEAAWAGDALVVVGGQQDLRWVQGAWLLRP